MAKLSKHVTSIPQRLFFIPLSDITLEQQNKNRKKNQNNNLAKLEQ